MNLECPDVRVGDLNDAPQVLDLCYRLAEENAMFPMDRSKVEQVIVKALSGETGSMIGISGDDEHPVKGCICLDMVSMWYSSVPFLTDVFNYVDPRFRRASEGKPDNNSPSRPSLARQQIRFAKLAAVKFNVPLFMAIMSKIRLEEKLRLYDREMTRVGGQFVYVPDAISHLFSGSVAA